MRNIIRFLTTTLVAVLLVCSFCMTASAATTPFIDVDDSDETLSEAVALLAHLNVTKGTTETTFGTVEDVTRQQMAAFIYRFVKQGRTLENASNSSTFTDLSDPTYYGYISWAAQTGVIKGKSDTEFDPEGYITLQDAYTMILRALEYDEEKLELVYPYSYIDIAESENVALDANLPANLDYTAALTRGNVAVLLYNAFFAETGVEEEYSKVKAVGTVNGDTEYAVETGTVHPTFAEYAYDVEVGEFVVRATPKYCFNDSSDSLEYEPLYELFDEENIHLVAKDIEEPVDEFYAEFEGLGLTGKADDHIMTTVKVYYTYEEKNGSNVIDRIYFASNGLRTLETSQARVSYKTVKDADDYLTGTSSADPNGYFAVGQEKIYFFDAPYTYIKPNYSASSNDDQKYWLRNEKNVKLIDIKLLDTEEETFCYYLTGKTTDTPEEFCLAFQRVLAGGVYKMKYFDVDGDGIYEYLHYMPATFGKMIGDEDMTFTEDMEDRKPIYETAKGDVSDIDLKFVPTIYYNGANIKGATFSDGDFVIAYINPEANMIDVHTVITPYRGYVSYVRRPSGTFKLDGKTFNNAYAYRAVEHLNGGNEHQPNPDSLSYHATSDLDFFGTLTSADAIGEEFDIYAYYIDGRNSVLYYKHTGGKRLGFTADKLIIPLRDEETLSGGNYWTESKFDGSLGERSYYTKVWLNGKENFVALGVDDMYPKLEYSNGNYNMSTPSTVDSSVNAYLEKIATYEVDADGRYIIKPFLHAYDDDGKYLGVNRDASVLKENDNTEQFGNDLGDNYSGKIQKVTSTRFKLVDEAGDTLLGDLEEEITVDYFVLTNNSVIIIKNIDTRNTLSPSDDEVEYLQYDMNTFGGATDDDVTLGNIQYVLKGDPDSANRAELLVLYAEARDFEFAEKDIKDGYRIVASYTPGVDEEGDYRNYYTLLNPFTGTVEEEVPGNEAFSRAEALEDVYVTGSVVEIKDNKVDESNEDLGTIDTSDVESGLVWITEYDSQDKYISVVPVAETEEACCIEEFNELVETFTYEGQYVNYDGEDYIVADGSDALYYEINSDTVITVLTSEKAGAKALIEGTYTLGDISVLEQAKKENKCYNVKYADAKGNYKTNYAPYLKAYVIAKEAKDTEDMPIAENIIVVVNGNDAASLLVSKCDNHQ
ncbi:MAG: S-layer homology domain-containing protein [Ruminococcus sp.]|nr:S-layer homology domain-containing protein [Ruminococcus sp.]MBP3579747.1 S-layer homology domain-containing protein [Clostridia bacterium]